MDATTDLDASKSSSRLFLRRDIVWYAVTTPNVAREADIAVIISLHRWLSMVVILVAAEVTEGHVRLLYLDGPIPPAFAHFFSQSN